MWNPFLLMDKKFRVANLKLHHTDHTLLNIGRGRRGVGVTHHHQDPVAVAVNKFHNSGGN